MNCAPLSLQLVILFHTLVIFFPINLEMICASTEFYRFVHLHKSTELESRFIEASNPNKNNVIVRCIYCHPHMDLNEFNNYHLNSLLDKLLKENKTVFLSGDLNIDLLKHNQHLSTKFIVHFLSTCSYLISYNQPE